MISARSVSTTLSIISMFLYMLYAQSQGTVRPYAGFNVEQDCNVLRKAMKGIGILTNISFLTTKICSFQLRFIYES